MEEEKFDLGGAIKEAESAVGAETPPAEGAPSEIPAEGAASKPAEETPQIGEFSGDAEYEKLIAGTPQGVQKRINEIYKRWKDAERKAQELGSRELSDDEILELAQKRGLVEAQQAAQAQAPVYDLENVTPEQRQVIKFIEHLIENKLGDVKTKLGGYDRYLQDAQKEAYMGNLRTSEEKAKEYVKGLGLNWDNVIAPQLVSLIQERRKTNPRWGVDLDVMDVTNLVLAKMGPEIGRRMASQEAKQLNEKKKALAMESEAGPSGASGLPKDASYKDIIREALRVNS